jgi:hypothetical protein
MKDAARTSEALVIVYQKTAIFILATTRTSNPTQIKVIIFTNTVSFKLNIP